MPTLQHSIEKIASKNAVLSLAQSRVLRITVTLLLCIGVLVLKDPGRKTQWTHNMAA